MEDPSSIYMFLSSINPFILLIAGIVVGLFVGFIIFLNKSNKTVPILNEQEDEKYEEDTEAKILDEKIVKRFDVFFDTRNENWNLGLIVDKREEKEYLFFGEPFQESGNVVSLEKKKLDK